jgi:hypothetical protein
VSFSFFFANTEVEQLFAKEVLFNKSADGSGSASLSSRTEGMVELDSNTTQGINSHIKLRTTQYLFI